MVPRVLAMHGPDCSSSGLYHKTVSAASYLEESGNIFPQTKNELASRFRNRDSKSDESSSQCFLAMR